MKDTLAGGEPVVDMLEEDGHVDNELDHEALHDERNDDKTLSEAPATDELPVKVNESKDDRSEERSASWVSCQAADNVSDEAYDVDGVVCGAGGDDAFVIMKEGTALFIIWYGQVLKMRNIVEPVADESADIEAAISEASGDEPDAEEDAHDEVVDEANDDDHVADNTG